MTDDVIPVLPVMLAVAGMLLALVGGQRPLGLWGSHLLAVLAGGCGCAIALGTLLNGGVWTAGPFAIAPFAMLSFRLDALAAFFLLIISLVTVAAALYAPGYIAHGHGSAVGLGVALNGFAAAMMLVVLADSVFAFLIAWELMSLVSFFLVVEDHHQAESRRAGFIYLTMTHVGGMFLVGAFLALTTHAGGSDFASLRAAAPRLAPLTRDLAFLAALVGFGTKAGLVPLHVWLPRAHPAAPSYASALMSGVMLKMAVYGLLRVGWELTGNGPAWWGGLLAGLGIVSAVLGVLAAMAEHDLKRLLAYSSVENIGIVFVGLGAGLLLSALGQPAAAAFALAAGLLHALNHAAFKGLLFLGAGAVLQATQTRDLEKMGGLIHRMPWTAGAFLIGAASIAGLPPLNGFASEWMTFQALLLLTGQGAAPAIGGALMAGLLALTSGLALFCFVKAFGIAFLGTGRSAHADAAAEVSRPMLAGMGMLAVACVALGLFPTYALRLISPVTVALVGAPVLSSTAAIVAHSTQANTAFYLPAGVAAGLLILVGVVVLAGRILGGPLTVRVAPPWVCGIALEPRMQYSAAALAKPIRIIFSALLRPHREVERELAAAPSFVPRIGFEAGLQPVYEHRLLRAPVGLVMIAARQIRTLQNGSLRTYLAYMFVTLVVALLLARTGRRAVNVPVLVGQVMLVVLFAPLLQGVIKSVKAACQNRRGPGLLQPSYDILKLLRRESVVSEHASWIFHIAPYVYIGAYLTAAALIPMVFIHPPLEAFGDAIVVVGLFALARFALALAALDTASNFGGMGMSRDLAFASLVEPALVLALFALAIPAGSLALADLAEGQRFGASLLLSLGALIIVAIAETGRIPIDNPDTHLELTMAHEGMVLEYSGRPLGLIFWGAQIKQLVMLALVVAVAAPWGIAREVSVGGLLIGLTAFVLKMGVFGVALALIESSMPKLRVFRVPDLLGAASLLAGLAVLSLFVIGG